jgi:exonuclease SbcC
MELSSVASEKKEEIREKYTKQIEELEAEIVNLTEQYQREIDKSREKRTEYSVGLNEAKTKIQMIVSEIENIKSGIKDETCPSCLQRITEDHKKYLNKLINSKESLIESQGNIYKELEEKNRIAIEFETNLHKTHNEEKMKLVDERNSLRDSMNSHLGDVESRLKDLSSQVRKLAIDQADVMLEDLRKEMKETIKRMNALSEKEKELLKIIDKIDEAKAAISKCENEIQWIAKSINETENQSYDETQLNSHKKQIIDLNITNDNLEKDIESSKYQIKISDFWKTGFSPSGMPSMLIDEAIPFMNEKVYEYLERLTNGRYVVSFDTLAAIKSGEFRDKISVNVFDRVTKANTRTQLSGGQTRIIDIATILTLGDLQSNIQRVNFNLLIFDEIFDSLDDENIGHVSKVLTTLKENRSIYLISHRHVDQLEPDEVLEMR